MTSHPRWLNADEQHLWRLMLAASRNVSRNIDDTLQACSGLSSPEFSVLAVLVDAEEQQMRLRDLCAELAWDRSRTSHQVTRMHKRGLVEKQKSPGDARGVLITLTDDGRSRLDAAASDYVETVRRMVFDHVDTKNSDELEELLGNIGATRGAGEAVG
ncbi:MarR family transcriptional regulator [Corynebacterium sp. BCW_4722]|nr:MarR family transcriptional regulator [Corynebacterium sp. BCW_4722]